MRRGDPAAQRPQPGQHHRAARHRHNPCHSPARLAGRQSADRSEIAAGIRSAHSHDVWDGGRMLAWSPREDVDGAVALAPEMSDPRVPDPAPDPILPPELPEMPPQPEPIDVPSPVPDNVPPPNEPGGVPPTSPPEIPETPTIPAKDPPWCMG